MEEIAADSLDGITVQVEHKTSALGMPYTITRYKGLKTYIRSDGVEILADQAAYFDYGPKLGGGWSYIEHRDYTPEQRAEGRRKIIELATQCLIEQGIW